MLVIRLTENTVKIFNYELNLQLKEILVQVNEKHLKFFNSHFFEVAELLNILGNLELPIQAEPKPEQKKIEYVKPYSLIKIPKGRALEDIEKFKRKRMEI